MVGNRYVVADLHGQYNLYEQIKEFINDNDVVYGLGDFGDRGYRPWDTLKAALDDPQFIYLMGNHDLMLIKSMEFVFKYVKSNGWPDTWSATDVPYKSTLESNFNGGWETLLGWANEEPAARERYYRQLKDLPLELMLQRRDSKDILVLSHAGFSPGFYRTYTAEEMTWERWHIVDEWPKEFQYRNMYILHGHTLKQYLRKYMNQEDRESNSWDKLGAVWYAKGHKCCLDMGSILSFGTVLLNLDTNEEHIFKMPDELIEEIKQNAEED